MRNRRVTVRNGCDFFGSIDKTELEKGTPLLYSVINTHQSINFSLESTLHLVLRLRGGAKKRKKKNYTTPKKIKHKHKKVKLAMLKFYKVRFCFASLNSLLPHKYCTLFQFGWKGRN